MWRTVRSTFMLLALSMICPLAILSQVGQPSVEGRVLDGLTGRPVPGAEVSVNEGRARVSTDQDGGFRITELPAGTYALHVFALGYEDLMLSGVEVGPGGSPLEMTLAPAALPLSALTIAPGSFSFIGRNPAMRQTMSRVDIESVPQFAEDIFRAVNRLPGLSSGDYSAHFSVRGGRHDETLILLDGLEIYEPYHLKDFNDGAISIIDVETIEGVELMTGGFPARHGNRTSGVFSVTTRDPSGDETRYSFGVSLINARAMAEGTFGEGRGLWLVSGRRGYLDLVLSLLNQHDVPSPAYHDVFGKVKYQVTPKHSVALDVLQASDKYTFSAAATTGFQDSINTEERANNRYGNAYAWVTFESLFGDKVLMRTIASAGLVTSSRDGTEFYTSNSAPIYSIDSTRDFSVLGLKQEWRYDWSRRASLEFGFDLRTLDADYSIVNVVDQDPDNPSPDPGAFFPSEHRSALKRNGSSVGAYLANRFRIAGPLTLEIGGRYDRGSYSDDSDLSPRVNALIELSSATKLRLGWGEYRQMQGIGDLRVMNGVDRYFPSELSEQWTAGLEHSFSDGGTLRIEAYRKSGTRLRPTFRNWKGGLDVFPETNEDRILVYPDRSISKGIELYHKRNINDRLSVRGSYAYAIVDETVSGMDNLNDPTPLVFEVTHGGPQDQRHALNVDATYRASEAWSLNASYSFHSGWPGTLESMHEVPDEDGQTDFVIRPGTIYGHRLPSYYRLDARLTKRTRTARGDLRFFVEVSNLTNHSNVFGYDYFRAPGANGGVVLKRDVEAGFIILPSLGISWTGNF